MRLKHLALTGIVALSVLDVSAVQASLTQGKFWAVIICTFNPLNPGTEFAGEAQYLYKVLTTDYGFTDENIYYLHSDLTRKGVDAKATKDNIRSAIRIWLRQRSTSVDTVFIYILSHGGGYNLFPHFEYNTIRSGRIDENGDEGNEVYEGFYGEDVNGDGDKDDWFGVDECIILYPYTSMNEYAEYYWDDELVSDLSFVSYWRAIVVYVGATTIGEEYEGQEVLERHCYSGGFIDDLSAPNRIIISPTNETYPSLRKFKNIYSGDKWIGQELYDVTFWGEQFISALDKGTKAFENADSNKDGKVSIWEAFKYAYEHDPAVQGIWHGGKKNLVTRNSLA